MNNKLCTLLALATIGYLLINYPFVIYRFWPISDQVTSSIVYLLFLVTIYLRYPRKQEFPSQITNLVVISSIVWLLYYIYFEDTSYLSRIVFLLIIYVFYKILYNNDIFFQFWNINNYFVLLQCALSVMCFILVAIGLLHPLITVYTNDDFIRPTHFFGLCFSNAYVGNLVRPAGFLDEPGALAAWAVYAIVLNYAFIRNKIISKYIPWTAIVTLSVAYYIQMGLYLFLSMTNNIKRTAAITVVVLLAVTGIKMTEGTDFDVYAQTLSRFEYSSDAGIAGNTRIEHTENCKKLFYSSPIVGIGASNLDNLDMKVSSNPYTILASDGIIGFTINHLPLLLGILYNRRKEVIIAAVVIFAGYLQRPIIPGFLHYVYLWGFFFLAIIDNRINQNKNI